MSPVFGKIGVLGYYLYSINLHCNTPYKSYLTLACLPLINQRSDQHELTVWDPRQALVGTARVLPTQQLFPEKWRLLTDASSLLY